MEAHLHVLVANLLVFMCQVGLGTETRYQYGIGTYVTGMNQNADFGAMPERSVEIFVLSFSKTDVKSIITGTAREK